VADLDLVIRGGTVVTSSGQAQLNVLVRDGRLVDVGPADPPAADVVDAGGLLVLPGMVDTHVHLMDPGDTEREDFPTGSAAAAVRGVTTVVEHTHARPVRSVPELEAKKAHLQGRSHVDFGLAAHVWPDRIDRLAELWHAGVAFFKIFTCTTHGVPGLDAAALLATLRALATAGAPSLVHAEDESITQNVEQALRAAGREDGALLVEWRSRESELVAVQTVCLLARLSGAKVTIAHASQPAVVDLVGTARAQGADVVAEACPQYFVLREQEVLAEGALRKFTPPARARTPADEEDMWALLRAGRFNHVSSDHAPSTRGQKSQGDLWTAPFGLPGLDTTFPLLLDAALCGRISLNDVVRFYSEHPARRYGLRRKGSLSVGADADLVLVDPAASWTLADDRIVSKAGWTPYADRRLQGEVVRTYLRGREIASNGAVRDPLLGRFLPGAGVAGHHG